MTTTAIAEGTEQAVLTPWQADYLASLDEVPGLDAEETRLLVGRFAFGVGDDDEVGAVLGGLDASDPEWLAVTMFSLGVATGHANEERRRRGQDLLDLREAVEIAAAIHEDGDRELAAVLELTAPPRPLRPTDAAVAAAAAQQELASLAAAMPATPAVSAIPAQRTPALDPAPAVGRSHRTAWGAHTF